VAQGRALRFDPIAEARRQWEARGLGEPVRMEAATSVMRAHQLVLAAATRALEPFGLTFARYEALQLLAFSRTGALPLGKMGARLMVHPASMTNAIHRLERDGLVRRVAHPTDRRTVLAAITEQGREVARRATRALVECRFGLGALSERDAEQLSVLVRRLRLASGDFEQPAAMGPRGRAVDGAPAGRG
jgi:DNA-binding MarR family transcriptional regulator